MPHSIKTPDGKLHTLLNEQDLLAIIEQYAGHEVAAEVKKALEDAKEGLGDYDPD